MFESVKQDGRKSGLVYAASLFISLIAHALIVCLLVLVPMIFFNVLQANDLITFLVEPPPPPAAPPAPSPPVKAGQTMRPITIASEMAPRAIPQGIPVPDDADLALIDPTNLITSIPGAASSGAPGGTGPSLGAFAIPEPRVLPAPPPPKARPEPIRVGALEQSKLIFKVNPVYPPLAAKAHVMGTVVLEAVINEEGSVSAVKVLSGHVLLADAAVQAVKQWKYSPTILNGEPIPVIATVTVMFRLN